jgi:hypothetical protein
VEEFFMARRPSRRKRPISDKHSRSSNSRETRRGRKLRGRRRTENTPLIIAVVIGGLIIVIGIAFVLVTKKQQTTSSKTNALNTNQRMPVKASTNKKKPSQIQKKPVLREPKVKLPSVEELTEKIAKERLAIALEENLRAGLKLSKEQEDKLYKQILNISRPSARVYLEIKKIGSRLGASARAIKKVMLYWQNMADQGARMQEVSSDILESQLRREIDIERSVNNALKRN